MTSVVVEIPVEDDVLDKCIQQNEFPTTRYVGSKRRFLGLVKTAVEDIISEGVTVLDLFGGSGIVSYLFKRLQARVTYNDYLKFNWWIGKALIENDSVSLNRSDIRRITSKRKTNQYPDFIQKTFTDYYYTDQENQWIDIVSTNIRRMKNEYKKSIAYYALFQACMIKRPWNMFNRRNLGFRLKEDVKRGFGNKRTWDTPFDEMFTRFANEAKTYIFSNGKKNRAINYYAENIDFEKIGCVPDVVYLDPPSVNRQMQFMDYHELYHFLEGIANYSQWDYMIDYDSFNLRLDTRESLWSQQELGRAWKKCISTFKDSTIVISYRTPSYPALKWIKGELTKAGKSWKTYSADDTSRVLTARNARPPMKEIVLIAR